MLGSLSQVVTNRTNYSTSFRCKEETFVSLSDQFFKHLRHFWNTRVWTCFTFNSLLVFLFTFPCAFWLLLLLLCCAFKIVRVCNDGSLKFNTKLIAEALLTGGPPIDFLVRLFTLWEVLLIVIYSDDAIFSLNAR